MFAFIKTHKKIKIVFIIVSVLLAIALLFAVYLTIRITSKSENERIFLKNLCGTTWHATDMAILDNSSHDLTKEPYISDGSILNNIKFSVFSDTVIFEWNDGSRERYKYSVIEPHCAETEDTYGSWLITYSDAANLLVVSWGQIVYYLY